MKKTLLTLSLFALIVVGCNNAKTVSTPETSDAEHAVHAAGHEVDGWCTEHEIPEADCALCNPKVADECKKNGDWCNEHDRPESQCFICDPSRKEQFVAKYEAQFGKKPPVAEKH